jgi:hypothetical protein
MKTSFSFRKVYGTASMLAAITAIGLILALFGDGMWDAISWVALAIPLSVIAWELAVGRLRPS